MHPSLDHGWDLSRDDARRLQRALSTEVSCTDDLRAVRTVGGVHVSYPRTASGAVTGRAAVIVTRLPSLEVEAQQLVTRPVTFPYLPDLRSFREAPLALAALVQLNALPDLLVVNGHGIADPQGFGIANHIGVLLGIPTIGCSTSPPPGTVAEPGAWPGAVSPLTHDGRVIGTAVRTRAGSRPLFVSVGHRISLETAVEMVLRLTRGRRQPEPLRLAVRLAVSQQAREVTAPEGTPAGGAQCHPTPP
jgi:deoxyribonuclease V